MARWGDWRWVVISRSAVRRTLFSNQYIVKPGDKHKNRLSVVYPSFLRAPQKYEEHHSPPQGLRGLGVCV